MNTNLRIARLVEGHTSGTPFWMVRCDECLIVMNSGHHYEADALHHAEKLAADHNAEVHGS